MKTIKVEVYNDYLEREAHGSLVDAVAELIWNGLDADAEKVTVDLDTNDVGGVMAAYVNDDGHGIPWSEAEAAFGSLGNSNKRIQTRSRSGGRVLHGKLGRGRFRAFFLGAVVSWRTRYERDGSIYEYSVTGNSGDLGHFSQDDEVVATAGTTGTTVAIKDIHLRSNALLDQATTDGLTKEFALYLRKYPKVTVEYNGAGLMPDRLIREVQDYPLEIGSAESKITNADLTIIEWSVQQPKSLVLTDEAGFPLHEMDLGMSALGYDCTAYVKSSEFRRLSDDNLLKLEVLEPEVRDVISAAREKVREHFQKRTEQAAADVVAKWQRMEIYPYQGAPSTVVETAEREVFDILALTLSQGLPAFEKADRKHQRLSMKLLQHAMETKPNDALAIMREVFDLPKEKQAELTELLKKTSLSSIISASKMVADRLNFLHSLEMLVFNPVSKEQLKERSQLHKIVGENTWIFGEEFNLGVSDKGLTAVLEKHLELLGERADVNPVSREDGSRGIVDLMLSRKVPQPRAEEREHLIVELKRPTKDIDDGVVTQIKSYAFAVADDEQFNYPGVRWHFWAVSNNMTTSVKRQSQQQGQPSGRLHAEQDGRIFVWAKTWGQIINESRARLEFYRNELGYSPDDQSALAYLRATHSKYLPDTWLQGTEAEAK